MSLPSAPREFCSEKIAFSLLLHLSSNNESTTTSSSSYYLLILLAQPEIIAVQQALARYRSLLCDKLMASQIPNAAISPFNFSRSYDELIRLSGRPRSDVGFMTALKVVDALITPELSPATARLQASPVKPTFSGWMRKQARSFPYALQSK